MGNKPPREIGTLRWEETSGVDHPANEQEGWVIMKSAGPDEYTPDEAIEILGAILKEASSIFVDAPAPIRKAATDVSAWIDVRKTAPVQKSAPKNNLFKGFMNWLTSNGAELEKAAGCSECGGKGCAKCEGPVEKSSTKTLDGEALTKATPTFVTKIADVFANPTEDSAALIKAAIDELRTAAYV